MKILITGDAGFVGREFHRQFYSNGHDVTGIDIKRGADCRDFFKASDEKFDLVVHLAAIVGGRTKIDGEPLAVATDLSIDAEMFNWATRTKPGRVVYYSSSAAYPIDLQSEAAPLDTILREDQITLDDKIGRPDQTYGWAKLTGEMLAEHLRAEGVPVHVLRPFSGYGEDQDLDYPFPSFIQRAVRKETPFTIWGDGTQDRDFIHISDVVAVTLAVVDNDVQVPVNLCTGRRVNFNELARMACNEMNYRPAFNHILDAPKGVQHRVGSPRRMLEFYTPKITLEEGVHRAVNSSLYIP